MQNNQNHQLGKCQAHSFCLKAIHKERRPNLNASLTMCRGKQAKNKKNKSNCLNYQGPCLNRDRCHATPAFILPSQKVDYQQSGHQILRQHEKRVKEAEEDIEELYVPKPRSKNMYCNVCRQNYEEYLDHIKSQPHKNNIRISEFNGYILQLSKKVQKDQAKELSGASIDSGSRAQMEESVQIIGVSGRKKVKTETQQHYSTNYYPFYNESLNMYSLPPAFNAFSLMQYPTFCNSYEQNQSNKLFFGQNYLNPSNCKSFTNLMQQQCINYPMFCIPFQPTYSLTFQQQA